MAHKWASIDVHKYTDTYLSTDPGSSGRYHVRKYNAGKDAGLQNPLKHLLT